MPAGGPAKEYRLTRLTNTAVKQNTINFANLYHKAASVVPTSFYVDDGLICEDSDEQATNLQALFSQGGVLLWKRMSSEPAVLQHHEPRLFGKLPRMYITESLVFTKVLGIELDFQRDIFCLTIGKTPLIKTLTKKALVSEVSKIHVYDVLGYWYSPTIIKSKILLQHLWEARIGWDKLVLSRIYHYWAKWGHELLILRGHLIPLLLLKAKK